MPGGTGALRAPAAQANQLLARLTNREKEVALAIAQGKPNAEIGPELFMSMEPSRPT
jgi:DNA-binding NarL/FixJ family response regulator